MANIASNTYLFYGDRDELVKCYDELSELYEKIGSNVCCVDRTVKNVVVNGEWIEYIEELWDDADSFSMHTDSKWYGNPSYWYNWVKANFPKLSVAFRCEEHLLGIFNQIDPDNELPDVVFVYGHDIPADDLSKLPLAIGERAGKYTDSTYYVCGTFDRDELFNSNFKPADSPKSINVWEYCKLTYEKLTEQDAKIRVFDDILAE